MHLPKEIVLDLNRPQLNCIFFCMVYIYVCILSHCLWNGKKKNSALRINLYFETLHLKVVNRQACFLKNLFWKCSENTIFSTSFKNVYITFSNYIDAQISKTVYVNTLKDIFLNLTLRRNELCNPFCSLSKIRYLSQCLSLTCIIFLSLCWFLLYHDFKKNIYHFESCT